MAYHEQLATKRALLHKCLRSALDRATPDVRPVLAPVPVVDATWPSPWAFRRKVHFVFEPASQHAGPSLGHFAAGGQRVVPVAECPVHVDAGNHLAWRIRDACEAVDLPASTPDGRRGVLRHVVLRVSRATGETMATLVVTSDRDRRLRALTDLLRDPAIRLDSLHVNVLEGRSSYLFGPRTRLVHGRPFIREVVSGISFLIGPTSFFQTNIEAAESLVDLVLSAVPSAAEVVDIYAGAGLFALPLARRGHLVTAIEEASGAVDAGRRSLRLNGLDPGRCRFVCARAEDAMVRLTLDAGGRSRDVPLAAVIDPPRTGCAPSVLRHLARHVHPDVVVYVSCEPSALARDLAMYLDMCRRAGVEASIDFVQPVDMFPHTSHVESVAVVRHGTLAGRASDVPSTRHARERRP